MASCARLIGHPGQIVAFVILGVWADFHEVFNSFGAIGEECGRSSACQVARRLMQIIDPEHPEPGVLFAAAGLGVELCSALIICIVCIVLV